MTSGDRINPKRLFTGVFTPHWLADVFVGEDRLSIGARLVYGYLLWFGDDRPDGSTCVVRTSQAVIAESIGISDRQLRTYLAELRDAQLIVLERGGPNEPGVIEFLAHPAMFSAPRRTTLLPMSTSGPERKDASGPERKDASGPSLYQKTMSEGGRYPPPPPTSGPEPDAADPSTWPADPYERARVCVNVYSDTLALAAGGMPFVRRDLESLTEHLAEVYRLCPHAPLHHPAFWEDVVKDAREAQTRRGGYITVGKLIVAVDKLLREWAESTRRKAEAR